MARTIRNLSLALAIVLVGFSAGGNQTEYDGMDTEEALRLVDLTFTHCADRRGAKYDACEQKVARMIVESRKRPAAPNTRASRAQRAVASPSR